MTRLAMIVGPVMATLICLSGAVPARAEPMPAETRRDVIYSRVAALELTLDLYLPPRSTDEPAPVVLWVHGGGWVTGDKRDVPLRWLTSEGYAVASLRYRLLQEAIFPAAVHDVQAAIRFLRGRASELGLDGDRLALAGASAGGHLASLVGLTPDDPTLDGRLGFFPDEPLGVVGVIDIFGPTDMKQIMERLLEHPEFRQTRRAEALAGLLRAAPGVFDGLSPVLRVQPEAPPFLIIHGSRDPVVPVEHSRRLHEALRKAGVDSTLDVVEGAGHGGRAFDTAERRQLVVDFLDRVTAEEPGTDDQAQDELSAEIRSTRAADGL